jgi:MarR family transcriptional regulator, lower aerobic nicotinate degradation pathway regulator
MTEHIPIPEAERPEAHRGRYRLDEQVGFLLRKAMQRHTAIFAEEMPLGLTPTQFAAMSKLKEVGPCSQNRLGRIAAMDVATIKGVVDRLKARHLVVTTLDSTDRRCRLIDLTATGHEAVVTAQLAGMRITERNLETLSPRERVALLRLLAKIS